ncbi:haloacid dehalogenase [Pseudomonas syringae pv. syringae PD2774]|uniref:HAD family hydrolase n=1 Tax=Pseudomonas syringae TaxID=317 RepID=UPI0007362AEA|nr:HAD family hydrolase [Pseudomonas syringae]KTB88295.1 haloacid dehalogenase [Pseudomonas syringae pv. syringae PD2774]
MTYPAVEAVIFDVFGTIARIGQRSNPYRQLFREARRQGLLLPSEGICGAMTLDLSFNDFALHLEIELTPSQREKLNSDLQQELASVETFPDAVAAIRMLQGAGIKAGVCSNLSAPYGPVVRRLFPRMDGYALSYELGVIKPDPSIYQSICTQMNVEPGNLFDLEKGRVLMIGDSRRCDQDGPRAVGVMGFLLDRSDRGQINDLRQFAQLVIDQRCLAGGGKARR